MPQDHRGRWVGNPSTPHGGHSVYPRLSSTMSRLYNITPDEAAGVIDSHRNKQDIDDAGYAGRTSEYDSVIDKVGTNSPREAIGDAFRHRKLSSGSLDNTAYEGYSEPYKADRGY